MSAITVVGKALRQNFIFKLYQHDLIDSMRIGKEFGFKELLRRRGAKFFYIIIGYYLVRDTMLYIVMPYLIARGLF